MNIETFNHNGCIIRIQPDDSPSDPSDWLFGKLAYLSTSRYSVGNERVTKDRLDKIGAMPPDECVRLPLYAYVHGNIALNTIGFSCPWDSAQCGFVYATAEEVKECFGVQAISPEIRRRAEENLRVSVDAFSRYVNGEYYGYILENDEGDHIDSCWGYDDLDYCKEQAKEAAEATHDFANAS